ncbi:MAG: hypothetical protein ACI89E_001402 [Planctomycetota bacterium]|jgi:hypothetical protein
MKRFISTPHSRGLALLALVAMGPAWAQTTDPPGDTPTLVRSMQEAASARHSRRVLKLKNGAFVRTACSLQNGMWVLGKKASAKTIPAAYVERMTLERNLLKDLKIQRKAGAPGTLPAWCLQRGLLKEGVAQLDKNLLTLGLRDSALEALKGYARFLPSPPVLEGTQEPSEVFAQHTKWLARKNTSSLHELCARSMARTAQAQTTTLAPDEVSPWDQCLVQILSGNKANQRELALSTLAHWQDGGSGKMLRRFAMLDRNEGTRHHAAWLLGTLNDSNQIAGLVAWLEHEHSEIRVRSANALGLAGYPAAVPALVAALGNGGSASARRVPHANIFIGAQTAYVQDFDVEVASGSSVADPVVNVLPSGVVLDAGVVSIAIHRQRTVYKKALNRITGHRPGGTEQAWTRWLQQYPTVDTDWRAPWPAPK